MTCIIAMLAAFIISGLGVAVCCLVVARALEAIDGRKSKP